MPFHMILGTWLLIHSRRCSKQVYPWVPSLVILTRTVQRGQQNTKEDGEIQQKRFPRWTQREFVGQGGKTSEKYDVSLYIFNPTSNINLAQNCHHSLGILMKQIPLVRWIIYFLQHLYTNGNNYGINHTLGAGVNPLRAKLLRGNMYIYLNFVSFLHIDTTQVFEILPQIRQDPTYST